jgi:hypothetical protein
LVILGEKKAWVLCTTARNPSGKVWEVEEGGVGIHIPPKLTNVNVMLDELSKVIPARCIIDHSIDLESGLQPPLKTPYQISRLELEELIWKFTNMIDVRFIRPSKSPYGVLVFF